jgi:hypothetical protein
MATLDYFTVTSAGIGAIGIDYVDPGTDPDETVVFSFVDFIAREPAGTVHWLSGLTPPRGIQLDPVRARYSPEDGQLRTIVGHPTNEQQLVTATGAFTLTYAGQTTGTIALTATPPTVQTALEALSNINPGDIYVSGVMHNEKQTITIATATGGTFKLATATAPTDWTGPISRNASASSVQAYLQALSTIGSDGCSVTGPTSGPWIVEFTGTLAGTDVGLLVKDQTALTPSGTITITQTVQGSTGNPFTVNFVGPLAGTDVTQMTATGATVTTVTGGTPDLGVKLVANTAVMELNQVGVNEVQLVAISGNPNAGTFTLALDGTPTVPMTYNVNQATMQTALEGILGAGNITVVKSGNEYTLTFGGDFANQPVDRLVADYSAFNRGQVTVTTIVDGMADKSNDLLYDVVFTVPDLDPSKEDRKISPFAIKAPTVGGVTIDLADAEYHLPPRPK